MAPPAAPSIYEARSVGSPLSRPRRRRGGRAFGSGLLKAQAGAALVLLQLAGPTWSPGPGALAQVTPPPPPKLDEQARRTLEAGRAMERSGQDLARQVGAESRARACSVFYLAQVAYARAVELGLDSAEADIDRLETMKQRLGCDPSGGAEAADEAGP